MILYWFLHTTQISHNYMYTYPLLHEPPSPQPPSHPLGHQAGFPVLAVCFTQDSVYMSMLLSQLVCALLDFYAAIIF